MFAAGTMRSQREILSEKALRIAHIEAGRQKPEVALLTGSAAWGTLSSRSDIDVIFVSSGSGGVYYRYYLPGLTDVEIRTEVGRIPLTYLRRILASGYDDEISTGIREQLKNARFLLGDENLGRSLISGFSNLRPKKRLLGEYLHKCREALKRARGQGTEAGPIEIACALDESVKHLWRLILVSLHHAGVQKDKHEIGAARRELGRRELEVYRESRRISDIDRAEAGSLLSASREVLKRALALVGVGEGILGDSEV
jgi:hypothetical protein